MKTKSLFSLAFYRDTLLRLRLFGIITAIVFGLLSALSSFGYLVSLLSTDLTSGMLPLVNVSLAQLKGSLATFIAIIIPIMTVYAFSFLMKRCGSDFFGVLPMSRSAMAVSGMLAVLTVSLFVITVSSVLPVLTLIPCMGKTVEYEALLGLGQFFSMLVSAVLAVAISALAVSVSGTTGNAIATSYIFIFIPRTLMGQINNSILYINPTLVEGHIIPFFDKKFNSLFALYRGDVILIDGWSFVYTILLATAVGALAIFLFRRRPSEAATHSFANPVARHISRILFATLISSTGIMLFCADALLLFVTFILVVFSIGAYFIYEVITGRKEGPLIYPLVTFAIYILLKGLIVAVILIFSLTAGAYSPSADNIDSVSMVSDAQDGYWIEYGEYVTMRAEDLLLEDEESREIIARAIDRGYPSDDSEDYTEVVFKIRSGKRTSYRRLWLSLQECDTIILTLIYLGLLVPKWLGVTESACNPMEFVQSINDKDADAERILATAAEEVNSLGIESWYGLVSYGEAYASISYTVNYNGERFEVELPIFSEMPNTVAACMAEYKSEAEKKLSEIDEIITGALSDGEDGVYLYIVYKDVYVDLYFESDDGESREVYEQLMSMITVDFDGEAAVDITCTRDGLFSTYISFGLSLKEGVSEKTFTDFLKECGAYTY